MAIWLIMLLIFISGCNNNDCWGFMITLLVIGITTGVIILYCKEKRENKKKRGW